MKALYFERTGGLKELRVGERERPAIGQGDVLVKVHAAAINPSDPKNVLGMFGSGKLPLIPGRDFSGVVVDGLGAWIGKKVLGSGGDLGLGRDGTHAEYLAVPAAALVEKPASLDFAQAATLGLSYLTAWSAIVTAGAMSPKDTLLVLGATGSVGTAAVALARVRGIHRIIGTARTQADLPSGPTAADDWIVLDREELPRAVARLTAGHGVDLVLDSVGGPLFEPINASLAPRGRHVMIASIEASVTFNLIEFFHREARLIGVNTVNLSFAESAKILAEVAPLVAAGKLSLPAIDAVPLDQAPQAYEAVLKGTARNKQVITFPA